MNKIDITIDEAYEKIKAYFSRKGAKLSRGGHEGIGCFYRHPEDGRACAVGCLIPDELYDPEIEGDMANMLFEKGVFKQDQNLEYFLSLVQEAHDDAPNVEEFLAELDKVKDFC